LSSRLDGDPSNVSTYYVTNGASTRTEDLDLRADYTVVFRDDDRLMLPAGHIPAMRAA
jgi:hypothetical protein